MSEDTPAIGEHFPSPTPASSTGSNDEVGAPIDSAATSAPASAVPEPADGVHPAASEAAGDGAAGSADVAAPTASGGRDAAAELLARRRPAASAPADAATPPEDFAAMLDSSLEARAVQEGQAVKGV